MLVRPGVGWTATSFQELSDYAGCTAINLCDDCFWVIARPRRLQPPPSRAAGFAVRALHANPVQQAYVMELV